MSYSAKCTCETILIICCQRWNFQSQVFRWCLTDSVLHSIDRVAVTMEKLSDQSESMNCEETEQAIKKSKIVCELWISELECGSFLFWCVLMWLFYIFLEWAHFIFVKVFFTCCADGNFKHKTSYHQQNGPTGGKSHFPRRHFKG